MKIFYSWQNDLDNKFNRNFIKEALNGAVKKLNAILDIDERVELDHDTKNVPGTPDIANVILDKIAASTVFIGDVSFVAERSDNNKKLPNSNVLIELGYALSELGSDRVICVMNTAYGTPDDLPFDLQHKRHPIQYKFNDEIQDKAQQKEALVNEFRRAISLIIEFEQYKKKEVNLAANPSKEEILEVIMASDSKDDWGGLSVEWSGKSIKFLKKNVNLRFEIEFNKNGIQLDNFKEEWANKHPNPTTKSYWCNLYYNSTHIEQFILVSVDGGRALLPLPNGRDDLFVKPLYYKVAQIYDDSFGSLDKYMIRSGLKILE